MNGTPQFVTVKGLFNPGLILIPSIGGWSLGDDSFGH